MKVIEEEGVKIVCCEGVKVYFHEEKGSWRLVGEGRRGGVKRWVSMGGEGDNIGNTRGRRRR